MATLKWNEVGKRFYQSGVDRGVLYPQDSPAVVWDGLTSVTEGSDRASQPFYIDGVKYLEVFTPGDFSAKLKAFAYPPELDECVGIKPAGFGLSLYDQPGKPFNLCYRTGIGNDTQGMDYGYKIHVIYNVFAIPSDVQFETLNDSLQASDFEWDLTAIPTTMTGFRPTAHVVINSTDLTEEQLEDLENLLYGDEYGDAYLPTLEELQGILDQSGTHVVIIDRGDGVWSAYGPASKISMLNATTFQITGVDATFPDANSYTVSTT